MDLGESAAEDLGEESSTWEKEEFRRPLQDLGDPSGWEGPAHAYTTMLWYARTMLKAHGSVCAVGKPRASQMHLEITAAALYGPRSAAGSL